MRKIAIIFGGKSVEHEVSILTGLHAAKNVLEGVKVQLVYLDRDNKMWQAKSLDRLRAKKLKKVDADVVLNCCHGGVGEAGELAAMLEVMGIPVTSSGVVAAKKMMSKAESRKILSENKAFIQPQYVVLSCIGMTDILQDIVVVKPDTLGSSIGVSVARDSAELRSAIELALSFDERVIVEEFLEGAVEVNCAAFRLGEDIIVSECEVIGDSMSGILGFSDKYLGEVPQFIIKKKTVEVPNPKYEKLFEQIKSLTRQAYELFEADGVVRCDFLVVGDKIYLNELNSVPGFLAYHLFMRAGIPYGVLIDMVCRQAIDKFKSRQNKVTKFQSNILENNRALVE